MVVYCRECGRAREVPEKRFMKIRPSTYLCPKCMDKDGKIGAGVLGVLAVTAGILRKLIK